MSRTDDAVAVCARNRCCQYQRRHRRRKTPGGCFSREAGPHPITRGSGTKRNTYRVGNNLTEADERRYSSEILELHGFISNILHSQRKANLSSGHYNSRNLGAGFLPRNGLSHFAVILNSIVQTEEQAAERPLWPIFPARWCTTPV